MGLVERRIGLLFAVFLGMLVLAGARAGWLGIVRWSSRSSIVSPSASRTSRRSPSWPRSCESKRYSSPESPLPSVPTLPRSCEAIQSRGYSRLNSGMNSSPSMPSFWARRARAIGTRRAT